MSADVVSSKTPAPDKFKEYSKIEADYMNIRIHLCSMSHGKSVLKVCREAYKLCGIESNHFFHTSETFKLLTVDVIFVCFSMEVFFKQDHMQENPIKKTNRKMKEKMLSGVKVDTLPRPLVCLLLLKVTLSTPRNVMGRKPLIQSTSIVFQK